MREMNLSTNMMYTFISNKCVLKYGSDVQWNYERNTVSNKCTCIGQHS